VAILHTFVVTGPIRDGFRVVRSASAELSALARWGGPDLEQLDAGRRRSPSAISNPSAFVYLGVLRTFVL
jgi:hypothetical protein